MRHYSAAKRADGRFDFVTGRRDRVDHAVGYCAPAMTEAAYRDLEERFGYICPPDERERVAKFSHKHHTDGHATAEEAAACYHDYLLDHDLRLLLKDDVSQHRCRECQAWTQFYAMLGQSRILTLCEKHNNRETVAKLTTPSTQFWMS